MNIVHEAIETINRRIAGLEKRRAFLIKYAEKFEELDVPISGWENTIDFDNLPHEKIVQVIAAFGGKWKKTLVESSATSNNPRVNYNREEPADGIEIRCWQGEPPPNCRIEEIVEDVPEMILPARKRVIKKLVCTEPETSGMVPSEGLGKETERVQSETNQALGETAVIIPNILNV